MAFVATIGYFDGVHKGHRFLIGELRRVAAERGLRSAVITLDSHPETILSGIIKPLLTTNEERAALLRETGIDEVFAFHFPTIRNMTAMQFMQMLKERYKVDVLQMGYDHHFGSDQPSDFADYVAFGAEIGLEVVAVSVSPDGEVSSSKIRKALLEGDVTRANNMLGYAYRLAGKVVHGNGIGKTIGFPTANILPDPVKLIPKAGVYAGLANGHRAVINIGTNPTVGNDHLTIEAHLIDYAGDSLYGKQLLVEFEQRLRDEQQFGSMDELRAQIQEDIKNAAH